jgi:hypothetical protein
VRSPTSTSTDAYTSGNITVTGGAGAGATTVKIYPSAKSGGKDTRRADKKSNEYRSRGSQKRMTNMIKATMAPRTPAPMPAIMSATGDRKSRSKRIRLQSNGAFRGKRPRSGGSFGGAQWGQEPPDIYAPKRPRLTYGKTSAQLDAEIDEALAERKL